MLASAQPNRIRWIHYLAAVGIALLALWLRKSLSVLLSPGPIYITFYPAVMVAALLGRLGPGLVATTASALLAAYYLIPPVGWGVGNASDVAGLVLFSLMGVFMSVVAELYHRQREQNTAYEREFALQSQRLESDRQANAQLEQRVAQRTAETEAKSRFVEALFEHSLDCLAILDKQFNFIRVNEAYARACHRGVSDFTGHNHFELYPHAENQTIFEQVLRRRKPFRVEAKAFVFPDHPEWGLTYWDWTLVPILDAAGEVDFLVLSLRDVTARERAQRELGQSESRYRSLVAATAQIVWTTDPEGAITDQLPTWQEFTGQTFEQYRGAGWLGVLHPDDRASAQAAWTAAVASHSPYRTEYRLRRHDGQYRHMAARGVAVVESNGAIREWIGICADITERKEAERRREFTSSLLALFVQNSTARDYLDSVVGIIRNWSGCRALGIRVRNGEQHIPYAAAAGFDPEFLKMEGDLSLERDTCCCIRAISGAFEPYDHALLTPGGSYRCDDIGVSLNVLAPEQRAQFRGNCARFGFASLAVVPIRYREEIVGAIHLADPRPGLFPPDTIEFIEAMAPLVGEAIHRFQAEAELAAYRDQLQVLVQKRTSELEIANAQLQIEISQRQSVQENLQEAARELERSNRDLEQFAYVASHDLQEPLRAVAGYVRLLERRFPDRIDPKAAEYVTGAADGAARMERLITDLLAFSRVGTHGGNLVDTDLNQLLRDALHNLQASIRSAQAVVTSDPLPSLAVDPTQIVQLFQNLLGNAIKFRSERLPKIHVGAQHSQDGWTLSVRDNGIGIERQYFDRIFQIFQRLHTRRQYPGTGIGLAICKRIIERHRGAIWVESESGAGSVFYFTLPDLPAKDL